MFPVVADDGPTKRSEEMSKTTTALALAAMFTAATGATEAHAGLTANGLTANGTAVIPKAADPNRLRLRAIRLPGE